MTRSTVRAEPRATDSFTWMHAGAPAGANAAQTLTWLVRTFELAQGERVRRGERIRAIAQARDLSWETSASIADADALLARIEKGETLGPVPFLGMLYQHAWSEEHELSRMLEEAVTTHPTWPWLMQIRGVGPRLAARLLSRLRIERARSPSAFWSYCGLATVQATEHRCSACGARVLTASYASTPARHRDPSGQPCAGTFHPADDAEAHRLAQPRARRSEPRRYDPSAKSICFLIGTSLSRQGGPYKQFYRDAYGRYSAAHPDWPAKRRVLAAMRVTVKLFLKHLWTVWREAEGIASIGVEHTIAADAGSPGAWEMVSPPSVEKRRVAERMASRAGTRVVRRGRPPKQRFTGPDEEPTLLH